jgi:hypothetical protein
MQFSPTNNEMMYANGDDEADKPLIPPAAVNTIAL